MHFRAYKRTSEGQQKAISDTLYVNEVSSHHKNKCLDKNHNRMGSKQSGQVCIDAYIVFAVSLIFYFLRINTFLWVFLSFNASCRFEKCAFRHYDHGFTDSWVSAVEVFPS